MRSLPLIVLTGPTASGKTSLAIELALKIDAEIVSADSMQIYKMMDIGTAKPTLEERKGVRHHLIDILEPTQNFSVAEYAKLAHGTIEDIRARGKNVILTGGTMLYIDSVVSGINFETTQNDGSVREYLLNLYREKGKDHLYNMLCEIDSFAAGKIHPNNVKRVIRALEINLLTGKNKKEYEDSTKPNKSFYNEIYFTLELDRATLYNKINDRVDKMVKDGLVEEVKYLYTNNLLGQTAQMGLGYKEIICYLKGIATLDEAIRILKRDTRRYAKRQITWQRRNKRAIRIDAARSMSDMLNEILQEVGYETIN